MTFGVIGSIVLVHCGCACNALDCAVSSKKNTREPEWQIGGSFFRTKVDLNYIGWLAREKILIFSDLSKLESCWVSGWGTVRQTRYVGIVKNNRRHRLG